MIDLHSHLIPGVDDGAENLEQARQALLALRDEGVRRIVTTPHLSGALTLRGEAYAEYLERLDAGWRELESLGRSEFPDLQLERGAEVMLDTPDPDVGDPRVGLAGSSAVLIEFPYMNIPPNGVQAVFALKVRGVRPVIAHPERYRNLTDVDVVDEWRSVGAVIQVNSGSLTGRYGQTVSRLAWTLLELGWVDVLSSDFHARGRSHIATSRAAILERGGEEQIELLLEENPARILRGEDALPVPPLRGKSPLWRRVLGIDR